MNAPGEALLIKLWDTLAEKGIGALLKPWQIKRKARAQIEARHLEIVGLAYAEREAEEIRSGRLKLDDSRYGRALPLTETRKTKERIEPTFEARPAIEVATSAVVADALRREVNVAKAITYAESELRDDSQEPPERDIESDWLYRWRDCAGGVSSEELQSLWGRLLAGELKSPGSYSYRTLEFIRNLSTDEAKKIERLSQFVIDDFVVSSQREFMESEGISLKDLLEFEDLGIISCVSGGGLGGGIHATFNSTEKDRFMKGLYSHGRALLLEHDDPTKQFQLPVYPVTSIGRQVMTLGKFAPHEDYLRAVGEELKRNGAKVSIANYRKVTEEESQLFNMQML